MKFGFMYNFRNSPRFPTPRPRLYAEAFAHMQAAEALGFASVWVPEHHLSDCGYNPAPLPLLAAMAVQTTRVTIGTSVLLLPFHHPVRVAEEAAAVDNLSNGRLVLGMGLGYRLAEFEGYGIDRRSRGGRRGWKSSCAAGPSAASPSTAGTTSSRTSRPASGRSRSRTRRSCWPPAARRRRGGRHASAFRSCRPATSTACRAPTQRRSQS